ncbi:flagella basal body P-ring formation protein FlgA [Sphingomonas soli]|uniref:flagella basal body P-ring formation protein FlgA n=1 Tax=Sphingomonas soli TaxID=266127 RepID=UPI00082F2572|nr:flagella basal body P-ring formation protein FlgA [Sphingomonas soli]
MLLLALAFASPALAGDFQSTRMLDTIVAQFTGKAIGELGGARAPVDDRLKLANCAAPQLEWRTPAQDAVVVRCMAPSWRIYVPVNAAPRPIAPAAPVAAVAAPVAKAEPVIRRGDAVAIEVNAAGFSISREGIAMGDAPAGGRLPIKVDEKKPPIQAIAIEPGRARLSVAGS